MVSEEGVAVGGDAPLQTRGFLERCEQQWQRTAEHARTYPYVWASYVVTFGGLGIYGAWRWRQLRKVEHQVMQYQRELLKRVERDEAAAAAANQLSKQHSGAADAPGVANSGTKQDHLKA